MCADFGERCGFRFSGSTLATSVLAVHGERRISFDQAKGAPLYKVVLSTVVERSNPFNLFRHVLLLMHRSARLYNLYSRIYYIIKISSD